MPVDHEEVAVADGMVMPWVVCVGKRVLLF
jgi:hypothetical protein